MSSIEADMNEVQTRAFIERKPVYIIIRRTSQPSDGAGGKLPSVETPLNAQRVRPTGQVRPRVVTTPDGRQVEVDLSLVGDPAFDVRIEDLFTYKDREYEVVNVQDQPSWRIVAEAIRRG